MTQTTVTPDAPVAPIDPARIEQFAGEMFTHYTGGLIGYLIDIAYRTGLFEALASGPATSAELADRASLNERYVREWLGAMATSGIVTYDAGSKRFTLPAEHAICLTGGGSGNLARFSLLNTHVGKHVAAVAECFRTGGGVPYEAFRPEFTDAMDATNRNTFDEHLIKDHVPMVPGLDKLLRDGGRLADAGCGTGHALVVLAREYPRSTFVGYDNSPGAIDKARAEASSAGLGNVRFECGDVASITVDEPYDAVITFDTIHDLGDPEGFLLAVHSMLRPGGHYLAAEPGASSILEENIGNPFAPLLYSVSTLHCLTVAMAEGGEGLGTAFGRQKALELLGGAGFVDLTVSPAPGDPLEAVFIGRRAA